MRRALLVALILVVAMHGAARAEEVGVTWEKSLATAKERSAKEKRPIIVDFWASWCGWCKVQDKEVFAKPRMAEVSKNLIFLKMNTEDGGDGTKLARTFGITGLPTVLVMDASGREMDRITGFHKLEEFIPKLQAILDGKGDLQVLSKKPDPSSQDLDKLAQLYVERGNYDKAKESWESLVKKDPSNKQGLSDDSMLKLAALAASQGKIDEAKKGLEALIKAYPKEPTAGKAKELLPMLEKGATGAPGGGGGGGGAPPRPAKQERYETIPGVSFEGLPLDKVKEVVDRLNKEMCNCGCEGDSIAQCANVDPGCAVAPRLAQKIVDEALGKKASK